MAASIDPISQKILDCAESQIVRQVGYLIKYGDNFQELEDKINQLKGKRQMIQHRIEEEEISHGNQREGFVQEWINSVDKLVEEARELVEDPRHARVGCQQWSCPNLRLRRKLSKMAKQKAEKATILHQEGNFERVTFSSPMDYFERSLEALTFESRGQIMKDMMEALKDPKKRIIGVYGLGGVGKTTLVKQVSEKAKNKKLFNKLIEVKVGKNPQLTEIQDSIAEKLDMKLDQKNETIRASRVRKRIEKEKSVLVILDDVWRTIKLGDVGIPEPSAMSLEDGGASSIVESNLEKGKTSSNTNNVVCKILMTSRSEDVLLAMESENNFKLNLLSEEETWNLFKAKVGPVVEDRHLHSIATQVAQKCAGLPVLISVLATILKGRRKVHDWKVALNKLAKAGNTKELNDIISSGLELCYNWLESKEVKDLFLLCGVNGGYGMVSDLLKYGIGLSILKNMNTVEDARNKLYQMIDSLKASCLLLDNTSMEHFTMHDIIREGSINIASENQYFFTKEENIFLKNWPMDDLLRCPVIILHGHCIDKLPERLECPKLEFFHLDGANNSSLNIPNSFFEGMRNLKVLDLTRMNMSSLPTSLSSLTKLKTLCLDHCQLEDITRIGGLRNLEILVSYDCQ